MSETQHKREALEAVIKVTRAARAGSRLELVAAFAEIEAGLRAQLEALPAPTRGKSGAQISTPDHAPIS
jgi:hypothetical protein